MASHGVIAYIILIYITIYECSPCDEIRQQFDEGVAELLSGKRATSIKDAYNHLIQKHYTEYRTDGNVLLAKEQPVEKIPTYKQFYLYFCAHTTKEQRDIVKTSAAEVRNSKRLLLSDSMYGVAGIGDMVEVDACEVDVSIVDTDNPEITVGRPILYCMIDVVTRVILAISVAFENNSIIGVTNLLMNLADDKAEYCRMHGVVLTNLDYWPSNIIPRRIRFDRGAECTSYKLETVLNRLHIERELVSAATGSLKGNIEQSFHQLHLAQNSALEDHGLIEKRHDSKHHKEATLDIHQYTKMVIIFVLSHNKMAIKGYPMSKELINASVHPVPIELWKFYKSEYGSPRPITGNQKTQFVFDLMQEATATISREGIRFIGHLYINEDDRDLLTAMYDAGTIRKQFPIRFDPRNMNEVFYVRDHKLFAAHLNMKKALNAGFENLSYEEMKKYNDRQNALKNEASETSDALCRERLGMNEAIVKMAEKPVYSIAKDMRSNREAAKQKDRVSNSLLGEISTDASDEEATQSINASASAIENDRYESKDLSKMTDDEIADYMMRLGEKIQQ
ncbi:MAG: Mu transposase C-terminal domain-containing protein [Erysipelotrichaceae bacterium]|nr:Mu transposase C-terminal domain-containing protein [Erysipelotrichaceae bacterium]